MLKLLARSQINTIAWNTCVRTSTRPIVYGYSWYLDAVLPKPDWKWVGLALIDETGDYRAVMPVPLRRKKVAGFSYEWVVHQPFFCQFLTVFGFSDALDPMPFWQAMQTNFRYGSILTLQHPTADFSSFATPRQTATQVLDLSVSYETLFRNYTADRRTNLRRARLANWLIVEADEPEALLHLFHENHAETIPGAVADWAYEMLRNLFAELSRRKRVTLWYATQHGRIEAGALFVRDANRIIYLFNASSAVGRRGNARTWLIDRMIQENAGCTDLIFDFESPEKPTVRSFYRSFGAVDEPCWMVRWNRLTPIERFVLGVRDRLQKLT
ncbi:GNAT family N-acetyltransferase [Spirosoma koreense]